MRMENQTADEAVHLLSGYAILRQAEFAYNPENPPVSKVLAAVPLLGLDLISPPLDQDPNEAVPARDFLYKNRVEAKTILLRGRFAGLFFTAALGVVVFWWTRRRFGPVAAMLALALLAFDPNFLAHGRYATSDVPAAAFFFAGVVTWLEFLQDGRRRTLLICGVATGLGIATKFNAGLLLPFYLLTGFRRGVRPLILVTAVCAGVIWAAHGFEIRTLASDASAMRTLGTAPPFADLPIPAYSFFKGIYRLAYHSYAGHPAYLLGRTSDHGWWYYFPVALAVKTPVATLALLAVTGVFWRRTALPLVLAAVLYLGVAMAGSINIGHRHLLPLYPVLYVAAAAALRNIPRVAALLVGLAALESFAIYPHYTAFFNVAAGGPVKGPEYLVDSNIDWGQDLLKLRAWMKDNHVPDVCLIYFGAADATYYVPLSKGPCAVTAISVTHLYTRPELQPFKQRQPVARIGYSINVYR